MISQALQHEYRVQRWNTGGWVGHNAEQSVSLARAYLTLQEAIDAGVATIEWECDSDADLTWADARTLTDIVEARLDVLGCVLKVHGEHVESLWGIVVTSRHDPYCHVVESELALEALEALQEALREVEDVMDAAY